MIIIRNKFIPFSGFKTINIFGILFIRLNAYLSEIDLNHEKIHSELIKETWFIFYYIIYLLEWLYKVLFKYPFSHKAYRDIRFEKEAYNNEDNLNYLTIRKKYNWLKL